MKISIVQPELVWEDKNANFINLERLIAPLYDHTDIIILPEMFNTGFTMNPAKFSEPPEGETFTWLKDLAEKGNFGICGSYMVSAENSSYNRWVFISPDNETCYYDKRHLFSMGAEDKYFTSGKNRVVFTLRGIRISPYICYDLRFPVWSRNRNEYDLAIYSANWPEARINVWNTLLQARSIENQCFVAGANIIGTDGNKIKYCGDSQIINARGEVIASASDNECVISADLSISELNDFRNRFPVFNDADEFTIDINSI